MHFMCECLVSYVGKHLLLELGDTLQRQLSTYDIEAVCEDLDLQPTDDAER